MQLTTILLGSSSSLRLLAYMLCLDRLLLQVLGSESVRRHANTPHSSVELHGKLGEVTKSLLAETRVKRWLPPRTVRDNPCLEISVHRCELLGQRQE